ncbi:MAG: hypothetical protein ACE5OO_04420, partial [Candidatus Bathyarchaeia archaeon]
MRGARFTRGGDVADLFKDRRVQIILAKFLSGDIGSLLPVFDPNLGYRYREVEALIDSPGDAEAFLIDLERGGLLTHEQCGVLACCPHCGSSNLERVPSPLEGDDDAGLRRSGSPGSEGGVGVGERAQAEGGHWLCRSCEGRSLDGEVVLRQVYSYHF